MLPGLGRPRVLLWSLVLGCISALVAIKGVTTFGTNALENIAAYFGGGAALGYLIGLVTTVYNENEGNASSVETRSDASTAEIWWKRVSGLLAIVAFGGGMWSFLIIIEYGIILPSHPDRSTGRVYGRAVGRSGSVVFYQTREERNRLSEILYPTIASGILSGLIDSIYRKKRKRGTQDTEEEF